HSTWHFPSETGTAECDFDLITGASGLVGYLASVPDPDGVVSQTLHTLLNFLHLLTAPGQMPTQERWFCPPFRFVIERDQQSYPRGRFNCGLAHGIPGPLASLALAVQAGYERPGLRESLLFVSEWLLQHQIQDEWGITWPVAIPLELASSPEQWRTL